MAGTTLDTRRMPSTAMSDCTTDAPDIYPKSRKQQACESSAEAQPGFQGKYDTGKAETGGPAFVDILYMVGYVANHGPQQGHGGSVGQTFEDSEQEDGLDVADAWQVEQSREESRQ